MIITYDSINTIIYCITNEDEIVMSIIQANFSDKDNKNRLKRHILGSHKEVDFEFQ